MEQEEVSEDLNDLRKKRLAYFETLNKVESNALGKSSRAASVAGDNGYYELDKHERSTGSHPIQDEKTVSNQRNVREIQTFKDTEIVSQWNKHSSGETLNLKEHLYSNTIKESINENIKKQNRDSLTGSRGGQHLPSSRGDELKTSSFYVIVPEHEASEPSTDSKSKYMLLKETLPETSLTYNSSEIKHDDGVKDTKNTDGLDAYNETVERLIKATKEELLGLKASDDIWTKIKTEPLALVKVTEENVYKPKIERGLDANPKASYLQKQESVFENGNSGWQNNDKSQEKHRSSSDQTESGFQRHPVGRSFSESGMPSQIIDSSFSDKQATPSLREHRASCSGELHPSKSRMEPSFHHHRSEEDIANNKANNKSLTTTKVEEIFSSRQVPRQSVKPNKVEESLDFSESKKAILEEKNIDMTELGLETHRPGIDRVDTMDAVADDINLGDAVSKELRLLLGEEKFKEFLMKSKKDIDDLNDRSADNSARSDKTPRLFKEKPKQQEMHVNKTKETLGKHTPSQNMKNISHTQVKNSQEFTPRMLDGEAVQSLLGEYILNKNKVVKEVSVDIVNRRKDKPDRIEEKGKRDSGIVITAIDLEEDLKNESLRPKLNRPKHDPLTIYQDKKGSESETNNKQVVKGESKQGLSKSYEQVAVSRNVAFSADEIYNQAYGSQFSTQSGIVSPQYERSSIQFDFIPAGVSQNPAGIVGGPVQFNRDSLESDLHLARYKEYVSRHQAFPGEQVRQTSQFVNSRPQYMQSYPSTSSADYKERGHSAIGSSAVNAQKMVRVPYRPQIPQAQTLNNCLTNNVHHSESAFHPDIRMIAPHPPTKLAKPVHTVHTNMYTSNSVVNTTQAASVTMTIPATAVPLETQTSPFPILSKGSPFPIATQAIPVSRAIQGKPAPMENYATSASMVTQALLYRGTEADNIMPCRSSVSMPITSSVSKLGSNALSPTSVIESVVESVTRCSPMSIATQTPVSISKKSTNEVARRLSDAVVSMSTQTGDDTYSLEETPRTSTVEVQTDREDSPDINDKGTLIAESMFTSVSQIHVNHEEKFVPHPPAMEKGNKPSPRRHIKGEIAARKEQDSKRHIDGIRHHHEQRRTQSEEERCFEEQAAHSQKTFAKASLERYFSSMENVGVDKPAKSVSLSSTGSPDVPDELELESLTSERYNMTTDGETVGISEANDDGSAVLNEMVRLTAFQSIEHFFGESSERDLKRNSTVSFHPVVQDYSDHGEALRLLNYPVPNEKGDAKEADDLTLVNSVVNTDMTVNGGGLTERLKDLGIELDHVKQDGVQLSDGDTKKHKGKGKVLIVCPDCQGLNKEYMSWCTHCGEMIIGVEPMLVSKNKEGKIRTKPLTSCKVDKISENIMIQDTAFVDNNQNVNSVMPRSDKAFTLNLGAINASEKEDCVFISPKKGSPIKSDKDSGRPSSDDHDLELQTQKIEEEVVNDICATISDPVLKGYVKSQFSKSHPQVDDSEKVKSRNELELFLESNLPDSEGLHSRKHDIVSLTSELFNPDISNNVQYKIAMYNQKVVEKPLNQSSKYHSSNPKLDKKAKELNESLFPPPLPNFSANLPSRSELSLKLPVNSMDYSTDVSQNISNTFEPVVHDELTMTDKDQEKRKLDKEERRRERRRKRGHGAIDVEVFGYDESRESRNSSRANRLVPLLNLAGNSSDEDDSILSDFKGASKQELIGGGSHTPVKKALGSQLELPIQEVEEVTKRLQQTLDEPDNSARPVVSEYEAVVENTHGYAFHEKNNSFQSFKSKTDSRLSEIKVRSGAAEARGDEDWKTLFEPETMGMPDADLENDTTERTVDTSQPFLEQLLSQPKPSKSRTRSKSAGRPVKSKVRQSLEESSYQRKWARSSTAWSSYNPGELNTSSSLRSSADFPRSRPSSASKARKPPGAELQTSGEMDYDNQSPSDPDHRQASAERSLDRKKNRPFSADVNMSRKPMKKKTKKGAVVEITDLDLEGVSEMIEHRLPKPSMIDRLKVETTGKDIEAGHMATPESTYDKYIQMTPRIEAGTVSRWQCLPDEILLHVFAYLDQASLTKVAQVCQQFYRVAMDESLWKYITIKKSSLDDDSLYEIAQRHPTSLALIQCKGDNVTAKGLRDLFKECADSIKELNISRCSQGALSGDSLLLHAAARCHHITHLDCSWCHVTDSGLMAIANCVHRLESLCISGCQAVSNDGLETVVKKHGAQLRVLEMFGCINLSPRGLRSVANNCINLITLNLGQCYKLTDSCISQLSGILGRIESLDLRGCKQIKDNCIHRLVKNCSRLKHLSLANCLNITDVSILEISTYLNDIRSLDVCGCKQITDSSVRALVNTCSNLRHFDISSTSCTHRSVSMIANFCGQRLETLKINFLTDVTEQSVIKLAKHCRRLTSVHMYGCTSVRNVDKIMEERPTFTLEM
ncbi:uncharacterized protein LOC127853062 isoform X2 [Dreissena polymorpha]|uniref:uncharacterized protein LOC127853062 isoform X2 n=1 Tax=Dreissena polymorpha TaxID=45954 RepID=UPI0022650DE2|nr:uncharacterized protein LOC127853062 isoform X2 [Dreissena polymorpha]